MVVKTELLGQIKQKKFRISWLALQKVLLRREDGLPTHLAAWPGAMDFMFYLAPSFHGYSISAISAMSFVLTWPNLITLISHCLSGKL